MMSNVHLHAKLTRSQGAIHLALTLENLSDHDLGVHDCLYTLRLDGTRDDGPNHAWIHLEGGVLHVQEAALTPPPGWRPIAQIDPPASLLPRGKTLVREISLEVPVRSCHVYRRALAAAIAAGDAIADSPAVAHTLEVAVGVFACDEGCSLVAEHPAYPRALTAFPHGEGVRRQTLLTASFALDPPLDVLDYRGVPFGGR